MGTSNRANAELQKEELIAIVDVGGNSVKAEFFLAASPLIRPEHLPEKIRKFCELDGAIGTKTDEAKFARRCALSTLKEIAERIEDLRQQGYTIHVKAVGTGPFRDADGNILEAAGKFQEKVKEKTGLDLEILSGQQEAAYSARAITERYGNVSGLVVDMGGSTAEFIKLENGKQVGEAISLPLGSLAIKKQKNPEAYIAEHLKKLPDAFKNSGPIYFMGGTPRSLHRSLAKLHGYELSDESDPFEVPSERFSGHSNTLSGQYQRAQEKKKLEPITDGQLSTMMGVKEHRLHLIGSATLLYDGIENYLSPGRTVPNTASMRMGVACEVSERISQPVFEPA